MRKINKQSQHVFGSLANAQIALDCGDISKYDLLFLSNKKLGWVNEDNDIIVSDGSDIIIIDSLPIIGELNKLYIVGTTASVWDGTQYITLGGDADTINNILIDLTGLKAKDSTLENSIVKSEARITALETKESAWDAVLSNKVDKINGKGLSTNDYTNIEKIKLSGISDEANRVEYSQTVISGTELGTITINGIDTKIYTPVAVTVDSELSSDSINAVQNKAITVGLDGKVDKVDGKGLSSNDYTIEEKIKLSTISEGAEVNIKSDWNQTDIMADDYILNKPDLGTAAYKADTYFATASDLTTIASNKQDSLTAGDNITIVDNIISASASTPYDDTEVRQSISNIQTEIGNIDVLLQSI